MENQDKYIYLDSAASASSAFFDVSDNFANPNSTHDAGRDAFEVLEQARECMASIIGAKRPSEIIFTSGATEANNMALFGIARAEADKRDLRNFSQKRARVIVSAIEHESVLLPARELEKEGFDLQIAKVDEKGCVDIDYFESLFSNETVLVSVQHANTEIGTIQNLKKLASIAHDHGALFHSDCVGSFGRISFDVGYINLDAASFSGHKIGTAKGIGALYLKAKTPCKPLIFGNGQENGMRGGTQNVSLAAAMQKAIIYCDQHLVINTKIFNKLKKFLNDEIKQIKGVRSSVDLLDTGNYLPNIVHLLFKDKTSENLILQYGKYKIQVAGGPACSSDDLAPSHVLQAIGISQDEIYGAIRISFSAQNTKKDIEMFIEATKQIVK